MKIMKKMIQDYLELIVFQTFPNHSVKSGGIQDTVWILVSTNEAKSSCNLGKYKNNRTMVSGIVTNF